jgi:hypothetical protein
MTNHDNKPSRIIKSVFYFVCALFCIIGIIATVVAFSFFMAIITQPTDKAISAQAAPHDSEGVRVWRIPSKNMQKRLLPKKEA